MGANFCQIDGDRNAGYHKLGYSLGVRVSNELGNTFIYETGFSYSLRGARSRYDEDNPTAPMFDFSYHMLDVPILVKKQYKKVTPFLGIITTYLLNAKDRFNNAPNLMQDMERLNIMGTLGTEYSPKPTVSFGASLQLSLHSITKLPSSQNPAPPSIYFLRGGVYHHVLSLYCRFNLSSL